MIDSSLESNSYSKSNLLEVQHVGVTAKLQSPLESLMVSYSSSTESENNQILHRDGHHSNTKYNKFLNEATNEMDTTITDNSKVLYEMKSMSKLLTGKSSITRTPSKIKFELYTKPKMHTQKKNGKNCIQNKKPKRQLSETDSPETTKKVDTKGNSIFQRLKNSLNKMKEQRPAEDEIFVDLPEPTFFNKNTTEIRIGIYPFEHGCAEYLKTHDSPPRILSLVLAERATRSATRFYAEFFGSLQIAIVFIATFLLQSYRFVLYSVVNILLVEFLHLTSDYLVKPFLTVIFNGFLQPPLIFCFNILSSIRDIFEPIADTINNFMKPVATVGRSLRLVHFTYNKENITKNV